MTNLRLVAAFGILTVMTMVLNGQVNTATITGLITDPSHAAVPGATVEVVNENTGFSKTATAPEGGEFTFNFLPIGSYTVTVHASGFEKSQRKAVMVVAGEVLRLDLQLQLGNLNESVSVTGETPLIETETSNKLLTVSNLEVRQLPQPKLDWSTLANTGPGVRLVPSGGARRATPPSA